MPRKLRQLRADLRKSGYVPVRQTGSHEIWKNPNVPGFEVNLVGHDRDDAKPYQERDVQEAKQKAMP